MKTVFEDIPIVEGSKITKQNVSRQTYTYIHKQNTLNLLEKFITKYVSVLNDDVRESVFKMEEILNSFIFTTFLDVGLNGQDSQIYYASANFDVNLFREKHSEYIDLLIESIRYFDEEDKGRKKVFNFKTKMLDNIFLKARKLKGTYIIWSIMIVMLLYILIMILLNK